MPDYEIVPEPKTLALAASKHSAEGPQEIIQFSFRQPRWLAGRGLVFHHSANWHFNLIYERNLRP